MGSQTDALGTGVDMKILLAAATADNPLQGVSGVMHSLAREYRKAGHEVRMVFQKTPGRKEGMLFGLKLAFGADRAWADVVDVHAVDAWPLCGLPRRQVVVARSHGLELVVHRALVESAKHGEIKLGPLYKLYRGSLRLAFERSAVRSADSTLVLNDADRRICTEEMRGDPERVLLVRNGFPAEFLRHPIGSGRGVAFVGSWLARKGKDRLVQVIELLLTDDPDQDVLLAGTGISESEVLAEFPEDCRARVKVRPKFDRADLPEILTGRGILLMASRSEGSPLSLMETMACGVVPVAMAIPGVVEVVVDGVSGILVPPGDVQAMAKAAIGLRRDPDRLQRMRLAAREGVSAVSWDSLASEQLALYERLIADRRSRT